MSTVVTPDRLEDLLIALLAVDTSVPAGTVAVEPGDPRIVAAVDDLILPVLQSLGPDEVRRHDLGEVAVRFGPPGDDGLLLMTYLVSQHGNLMEGATDARIADGAGWGLPGPVAIGQGANQNKGPMAAAIRALSTRPLDLRRPVWLAVNLEGRSSHGGSQRILDDLGVHAAWGITCIGTDLKVSTANRGRADVVVEVIGESAHSSQPWLGRNPLEGLADVITALRDLPLPAPHPELGGAAATPFRLETWPIAPHTLPARARLVVDRRLLPGEDPEDAVEGVRRHLASLGVALDVTTGDVMLPAEVPADAAIVTALADAVGRVRGEPASVVTAANTFDAGWACHRGIPTVMFGPGRRRFDTGVTAAEMVAIDDCRDAATALRQTIRELCT